ncbi:related to proteins containing the FAD binding domain [Rhynchosporium graminicola]|uniref:D-lactate dehydrogenase (cytochrome) n=1 Tax=Rhynchosporium graminicola TaxID=2792576 RepID=A0A1E1LQ68_9HELO|nr:related to proteins containing the FAD binding domain [Rhynchosporium commune]
MSHITRARTLRNIAACVKTPTTKRCKSTFESKPYKSSSSKSSSNSSVGSGFQGRGPLTGLAFGAGFGLAWVTGRAYQKAQQLNIDYARDDKFKVPRYGNVKDMEKAINEISEALGTESISTDAEDLRFHGFSEWSPSNIDSLPIAVVYPKSTAEVSTLATICHKYKVPMTAFSGGSSLEGNFSAPHGGLSIDFKHMNKIVAFHEDDMDIVVQPSCNWVDLNTQIKDSKLFFPVDPSPSAQIGGMVGTNCSGTNAVRYGTMKDWVLNMTVVLADGQIIKTKGRGRSRKSAAGYNLNSLFVGSEGTLGLVTEITLKLAAVPKEFNVGVVTFPSVRDAAATATAVMRAGVPVAALEFLDEKMMEVLNEQGHTAPKVWEKAPTLFFKFSGTKGSIADNIKEIQAISKRNNGSGFQFAKDQKEQDLIWSGRKQALWSLLAARPEGTSLWTTDIAVPVKESEKGRRELGLFSSVVGHLGDGNFHEAIMFHSEDAQETAAVDTHVKNMITKALEMEGTSSGEHSIGLFRKAELLQEVGSDTLGVMKSIKQALDPHWLMNPGKIFDTPVQHGRVWKWQK